MKYKINSKSEFEHKQLEDLISSFSDEGSSLFKSRNEIKVFRVDGVDLNIKKFRVPNLINKIAYRFFRKSKAQRSFEYASYLQKNDIGTPKPIAYFEWLENFQFLESFYVSEHLETDLTYRELVNNLNFPDHEKILRSFTRFTFELHQKNIQFLDHSPGNTLIKKEGDTYRFYLVDLNRMNFKELSFDERMQNFSRLTPHVEMIRIMANEYAKLIDKPEDEVFNKMWYYTDRFQKKFHRKKRLKKMLKK